MNDLGIHALVWTGGTGQDAAAEAIEKTAAAGYDLLEFSLHDGFAGDVASVRSLLLDADLQVACSRGLNPAADISSVDMATVHKGVQLLVDSIEITQGLGGQILTGALYGSFGKASAPLSRSSRANVVAGLREVSAEARRLGVTLGLEACNRYETNVINTAEQALRMIDDVGSDNIKVHLDIYHMNIEETDFVSPVLLVGDQLGYVHVGENNRGYLGSGHLDFASFFRALSGVNYGGPITFESFSSAVIMESLSNDLAIWRNMWDDGMSLALQARQMMEGWLEANSRR